jgi:DNA-binding transcriptional MerR regulator
MLIGELSKKSGLSRDTIRFYEKHGLIAIDKRARRTNNYKEYSEDVLKKLLTVKRVKSFGFTLNESADLLKMIDQNEASCKNVLHKIDDKVKLLDDKIRELIAIRSALLKGLKNCEGACDPERPDDNCPILC